MRFERKKTSDLIILKCLFKLLNFLLKVKLLTLSKIYPTMYLCFVTATALDEFVTATATVSCASKRYGS